MGAAAPGVTAGLGTKPIITVTPETTIFDDANAMLRNHVSGLPVAGKLVGIASDGDILRRTEIGTSGGAAAAALPLGESP